MQGKDIKEFRKREGLTQLRLSEMLDVDITTVGRWERDLVTPGPDAVIALRNLMTQPLIGSLPVPVLCEIVRASPARMDLLRGDGVLLADSAGVHKVYPKGRPTDRPSREFVPDVQRQAVEMMFGSYENFYREVSMLSFKRVEYKRPHHTFPSDHRVTHYFNTEIGPCYLNCYTRSDEPLTEPVVISID